MLPFVCLIVGKGLGFTAWPTSTPGPSCTCAASFASVCDTTRFCRFSGVQGALPPLPRRPLLPASMRIVSSIAAQSMGGTATSKPHQCSLAGSTGPGAYPELSQMSCNIMKYSVV